MNRGIDFNQVYKEFHPRILHYISRLTDGSEAEDITQEVFQKISSSLDGFKEKTKTLCLDMPHSYQYCFEQVAGAFI